MRKLIFNEPKFKKLVVILFSVSAALLLGSIVLDVIFANKVGFVNYLAVASQLPILIVDCFFIVYQSLNKEYVSDNKYLHYFVIILLLNMASYFTGLGNSFSNIAFHSIQQFITIALILNATFKKGIIGILCGLVIGAINFLQLSEIVLALDIIISGICITKSVSINRTPLANMIIIVCCCMIGASILCALSLNYQIVHRYFHLVINFATYFAIGYCQVVADIKYEKRKTEINNILTKWIDKAYQQLSMDELLRIGVSALKGVSVSDGEILKKVCGIETIADLANNKYFNLADELVERAKKEIF